MAIIVCELCGYYDVGTWNGEVFLWREEAGVDSIACADGIGGDSNDATDYTISLWYDFVDFGRSEFINTADFAVGDGAGFYDGSGGRAAWCRNSGGVVCEYVIKIPYCGGRVVWRDEAVFGGGAKVSGLGVWGVWDSWCNNDGVDDE